MTTLGRFPLIPAQAGIRRQSRRAGWLPAGTGGDAICPYSLSCSLSRSFYFPASRLRRSSASSTTITGRTIRTRRCSMISPKKLALRCASILSIPTTRWKRSCWPASPATTSWCRRAYFLARQIKAGIFQQARQSETAQSAIRLAGDRETARRLRSRQPLCRQLYVGHDRHWLQRQGGETDFRSGRAIDSWDYIFNPDKIAKFKNCGIHLLDSSDDIMSAGLHYLHLDPNTSDPGDLEKSSNFCSKSGLTSANSIHRNISTRSRPARSAWSSAFPAT